MSVSSGCDFNYRILNIVINAKRIPEKLDAINEYLISLSQWDMPKDFSTTLKKHAASSNIIKRGQIINLSSYLPPGQNGCHFADDIFGCIFVKEKFCILIAISPKFL